MQGQGFEPEGIRSRHMSFLPAQILDPQSEGRLGLELRASSAQVDDRSNPTPSSTGGFGPGGARTHYGFESFSGGIADGRELKELHKRNADGSEGEIQYMSIRRL